MATIAYYCREAKMNKKGLAPVEAQISIDGVRRGYSLDIKYNPKEFKKLTESKKNNELKEYLATITCNINKAIMDLTVRRIPVSHFNIKEYIKNGGIKSYTIDNLFTDFIKIKDEDNSIIQEAKNKYHLIKRDFYDYLHANKHSEDMEVNEITHSTIIGFSNYIYSKYNRTTAPKKMVILKAIIRYGIADGKLNTNPFNQIKIEKPKPIIEYLTEAELNSIKEKDFNNKRLNTVKDLFLIQAGTGLAYADLAHLTVNDIIFDEKSNQYIIDKERIKTGVRYTCVILPFAMEIMSKYMNNGDSSNCTKNKGNKLGNYLNDNDLPFLPVLSNQKYNGYLKEISDFCGIKKSVHTHLARKTYATFLLNKGVRLEVVSRALGHSSVKISEKFYAKMETDTVVSEIGNILR